MKYVMRNRNNTENIYKESNKALNFLYGNFLGRLILKLLIGKSITKLIGKYYSSKKSIKKIEPFIKENNIDMSEYPLVKYTSFNDFFTRKILLGKRIVDINKDAFISPCDSKLSIYDINENLCMRIKDAYYSVDTLVNKDIMKEYIGGKALVFRLDVSDYHRYCYIDSGYHEKIVKINGVFHTVQPIALKKYNFYKTNSREYTVLYTQNYGKIIEVEIGAFGVGKIVNHFEHHEFKKGEEKGYFKYGGSTIVLLVKKDMILFDEDILNNSKDGIETIVKYGMKIGQKIN